MFDIIVIGGTNIDIKAKTASSHIAGTSNPGSVTSTPGGVARNIAHNLANLGVSVALISAIGDDLLGGIAADAAAGAGVDLSMCLRPAAATGCYVAVLDGNGELVSAINDMRILELLTPQFVKQHGAALEAARFIVVDCNVRTDLLEYLALHYSEKLIVEPVSVAKSQKLGALLDKHEVFLATPNRDQLAALAGVDGIDQCCRDMHERGLHNLVVHRGADGATVSSERGMKHLPCDSHRPVSDVTGAGDAAVAGLVYGLIKGYDILTAARIGQAAAGLVLGSSSSTAIGLAELALQNSVKVQNE